VVSGSDGPDVLDVLASMRPTNEEVGGAWPEEQRGEILEMVLSARRPKAFGRFAVAGIAVAAVSVAAILLGSRLSDPGRPIQAVPAGSGAAHPSAASTASGTTGGGRVCVQPSTEVVKYALEAVKDPDSEGGNGYSKGWLSAAMAGDVLAIQRPTYTGKVPSGTTISTLTVMDGGTNAGGSYGPVTDRKGEAAAIACLEEKARALPAEPDMACHQVDLSTIKLRQTQTGPATTAYGSRITDAAQVDAGDGYSIVAVRLERPLGPDHKDFATWINDPGSGWIAPVSKEWLGSGTPEMKAVVWGQLARDAAISCLD